VENGGIQRSVARASEQLAAVLFHVLVEIGASAHEKETHALRAFTRFLKLAMSGYVV
jgi:hypothetical protein